ncbi:hypothetical protein NKH18_01805 [Streptomyces sp. M10(2022)]
MLAKDVAASAAGLLPGTPPPGCASRVSVPSGHRPSSFFCPNNDLSCRLPRCVRPEAATKNLLLLSVHRAQHKLRYRIAVVPRHFGHPAERNEA